jgi:hypothetical protein
VFQYIWHSPKLPSKLGAGGGKGRRKLKTKGMPKLKKNYYSNLKAKAFQQFSQQNPYNTLKWLECKAISKFSDCPLSPLKKLCK